MAWSSTSAAENAAAEAKLDCSDMGRILRGVARGLPAWLAVLPRLHAMASNLCTTASRGAHFIRKLWLSGVGYSSNTAAAEALAPVPAPALRLSPGRGEDAPSADASGMAGGVPSCSNNVSSWSNTARRAGVNDDASTFAAMKEFKLLQLLSTHQLQLH